MRFSRLLSWRGSAPEHRRGRGVRLDLTQPDWKTSVYVDEGLLYPLQKIFGELATFLARRPELIARGLLSRDTAIGSREFRNNPERYPLTATYIFESDLPTLNVNGVWFPGLMPVQVSDVLAKAIDELRAR